MAGRASRSAWHGGPRLGSGRRQGHRTAGPAGRSGVALRDPQAVPATELPGTGVPPRGLRLVSRLCPPAVVMEPTEVGAAKDDQRDPARDLGTDQSDTAVGRSAGEARRRRGRAAGQHRDLGTHARAERQQPALGCSAGHGAPAEAGRYLGRRRRLIMARSLPRSQEARPQDPVHARSTQSGPTLPRADRNHPRDLGLSEAGDRAIGRGKHAAHRTVAAPGSSLSAAGRTHHQTERAAGVGRRAGAGRREVGQPVRSRMPISSSKAAATPSTATNST